MKEYQDYLMTKLLSGGYINKLKTILIDCIIFLPKSKEDFVSHFIYFSTTKFKQLKLKNQFLMEKVTNRSHMQTLV